MAELWDILDENGNFTGRYAERGKPLKKGEYHLVVEIWILNSKGEFLISQRSAGGTWHGLWQTTGGCAVAGDDSLKTALKETREEIGIELDPKNGLLFKRYSALRSNDPGGYIKDVWLFRQEADISSVVLQPGETCDAMWASKKKIMRLIDENRFIPKEIYPYLDALFEYCGVS
ncbi:MAG TPA: NUDIX domain-containing protein [Oscillospiraceae bacterium]|nr:NUDIX domain-containing protein [Oscillospiraceae bacterium]HPF56111.1 NUDIX domain-containing protein [Clostridiales bacterium]HPK34355.1 NUDIX domain-containing protein [Oscillospiraceae bacterium]HPR75134.1 NUDIX domain-containing protein [Oscillospiraceae bacterium]